MGLSLTPNLQADSRALVGFVNNHYLRGKCLGKHWFVFSKPSWIYAESYLEKISCSAHMQDEFQMDTF